jgi:hypothetical protein
VVGSSVNITSRIQEQSRKWQILISDAVLDKIAEGVDLQVQSSFPADLNGQCCFYVLQRSGYPGVNLIYRDTMPSL